jgi:iron(II)-dependent oxidoreductase
MTAPLVTLRVNFSHEDKEAKGLRSLKEPRAAPATAVYFTADEIADMQPRLLLTGERGAGKSTFAEGRARRSGATLIKIEDDRQVSLPPGEGPVIIDGIDRLRRHHLQELDAEIAAAPHRAMLLLGETAALRGHPMAAGIVAHDLRPLSREDRAAALQAGGIAAPAALASPAGNAALFGLSLEIDGAADTAEALIDAWASLHRGRETDALAAVAAGRSVERRVDDLLAARVLAMATPAKAAELFRAHPDSWTPVLASLATRRPDWGPELLSLLAIDMSDVALRAALLLADVAAETPAGRHKLTGLLLAMIEQGRLTAFDRDRAAQWLAIWGDQRDLQALCAVPGGIFTMGSSTHANSTPVHQAEVGDSVSADTRSAMPPTGFLSRRPAANGCLPTGNHRRGLPIQPPT